MDSTFPRSPRRVRAVRLGAAILVLLAGAGLRAAPLELTSGPERTALVELYTSEGCNSCPPADRWIGSLVDDDGLWTDFVPVAFHVTYWNYLGWRDAYADPAFDLRQRRTARRARSGVYTPGVFQDGAEWRRWRRGARPGAEPGIAHGRLDARLDDAGIALRYTPEPASAQPLAAGLVAYVAWLSGASSDVTRGENRGRRLRHEFTVRRLDRVPLRGEEDGHHARAALTAPEIDDSPAVALWVEDGRGRILQATGGWLPAEGFARSGAALGP